MKFCLFCVVFAAIAFAPRLAARDVDSVWVAVEFATASGALSTMEYSGRISRTEYDALLAGKLAGGFLSIQKAFFNTDGKILRLQDIPVLGYTSHVAIRSELILRVKLLRDTFVDGLAGILDAPDKSEDELKEKK